MNEESARQTAFKQTAFPDYAAMTDIAVRSQKILTDFFTRHAPELQGQSLNPVRSLDPVNAGGAFGELTARLMSDPGKLMQAQMSLWQDYLNLWQSSAGGMFGQGTGPVVAPERQDNRFRDEAWSENPSFVFLKQSYLLTSRWVENLVGNVDGLAPEDAHKVAFHTKCFMEALSPTNFVATNPAVLRETMETNGENLLRGLQNLLEDFEEGDGKLKIRMTHEDAFDVGVNVATTPGSVIYRNDLMELIQFDPSTPGVHRNPVLVIPPWINKYYILDMREENSYVKWLVDQGHTVFIVSWVNPGRELAEKSFEDYMLEGPLAAIEAIEQATGERTVNMVGYCIGGTLLACALAWMARSRAKKWQNRVASATFLATLVEFSDVGDIAVFIDEKQVSALEDSMNERGYLDGSEMAGSFSLLRSSDLIWSFVINNYLMGKEPFPFDLLYWNSDSTRMPAAMHSYYLRNMYMDNRLIEPGALTLGGAKMDLGKIRVPVYLVSARDDHIAPWRTTYKATGVYGGDIRFVLSASGHIAGVVNPPDAKKYCHWTNETLDADPDVWLDGATAHNGSWWTDWQGWVSEHTGKTVPARTPGTGGLPALEAAPGTYVRGRA